jgi:hypothetical protein
MLQFKNIFAELHKNPPMSVDMGLKKPVKRRANYINLT